MDFYALYRFKNNFNYQTYNKSHYKNKDIRCGGIIINNNLDSIIIVLNRESKLKGEHKWGLPKGHIKYGENFSQCAQREIEEETGLNLQINERHPRIKINDTYYFIIILDENTPLIPKDTIEIAEVKWEKIMDLHKLNTNRGLKKIESVYPKIIKLAKKTKYFVL
jgi:ADP-ribose pyrophosphatase YjhB (NUDIX family)